MDKYVIFNGEKCKLGRIVNSNVCIETKRGIRFVHISRVKFIAESEEIEEAKSVLDDMTKAELIEYAIEHGIEVDTRDKKAAIKYVIENA